MTVALLDRMDGVGATTLALHLAGRCARQEKRMTLIDADPQRSALDPSARRAKEAVPRLFGVIGLARDTLHREPPKLRTRIKITAFQRGQTAADTLRDLLARAAPAANGGQT